MMQGKSVIDVQPVELKFGGVNVESPELNSLYCAVIVGIICGLLGSFFVMVNARLAKLRKKYITKGWQKIVEAALFALATSSAFYWGAAVFNTCEPDT